MFYDAEGSRLFERITALPEYYPTRTERGILAKHADSIVARAPRPVDLPLRIVELGAGTAAKTRHFARSCFATSDDVVYVPVDVSSDALESACQNIACALPEVRIQPISKLHNSPAKLDPFEVQHSRSTSAQASATFRLKKRV